MKIWIPYMLGGSGTDVFSKNIASALRDLGQDVELTPISHYWQYLPWGQRYRRAPPGTDIILTNSWNGFIFSRLGAKLVTVVHLCVHDRAFAPYRNFPQAAFHSTFVRYFEAASLKAADAVVAVSQATAKATAASLGQIPMTIINNGIDTEFFCPSSNQRGPLNGRPMRLLFVGNLTRRKGADLLPKIVGKLGPGFELRYTSGLKDGEKFRGYPGMMALGCLDPFQTRASYRDADLLLFPTRLEGLPLVAMEALACGTPVVGSNSTSMPEVVKDGETGILCPRDDVGSFAEAIMDLRANPDRLAMMRCQARLDAVARFDIGTMACKYLELFQKLLERDTDHSAVRSET